MERLQKNDDIRRTTRIIQIDEMLRGGAYVKIDSLVQKFEVSQRTIERDFERLRDDLNAPLCIVLTEEGIVIFVKLVQ